MKKRNVGILHPGAMGVFVAACIQKGGHTVYWASAGRSSETLRRAEEFQLADAGSLAQLCETCDVLVSVCPPAAAEEVARQVLEHAFHGLYLDANAISPHRAARIGRSMEQAGVTFVDGGIVGGPAWEAGQTWLYLSAPQAAGAAALFAVCPMEARIIGAEPGQASALKMCYAAYTKGTTALLCAILAAAEELDVRSELEEQWSRDWEGFAEQTRERVTRVTAKAWRFEGEMAEIAATFQDVGLPAEFHLAAAQIYGRLAKFKDATQKPTLQEVLGALLQDG